MGHPFRRYCFYLAEKLGKHVHEIMQISSAEICEWMAYDLSHDEKWCDKFKKEEELERQRSMSNEERAKLLKRLLGGG